MSGLWWKILVRKAPLYDKEVDVEQAPQNVKGGFDATDDFYFPRLNKPNLEGSPISGKSLDNPHTPDFSHFYESPDKMTRAGIIHQGGNKYGIHHFATKQDEQAKGLGREGLIELRRELERHHGGSVEMVPIEAYPSSQGFWDKMQSENITNMLKEAKSPKALAHKRKYETEYESSPARKKYRRELEGERRKRGVAGKGGKDMSHTKTGKIVPEDPHTNRARSHPSVGSTLKMVVVKAPQMNLSGESAECELCGVMMNAQETAVSNQQMGASVCTACLMQEQQKINQQRDDAMVYHGEPMDIAMRLLKDFNTCYQCGQTWEQLGLANALPIQRSLHEDRCMGMVTSEKDSMFRQQ